MYSWTMYFRRSIVVCACLSTFLLRNFTCIFKLIKLLIFLLFIYLTCFIIFIVPNTNLRVTLVKLYLRFCRVGSNELMGCCCVGPLNLGPGKDHWYDMLENPRKPIAQWYPLQESLPTSEISPRESPTGSCNSKVK